MKQIILFSQLNKTHIPAAGGKGANLGELTAAGFPVPPGFVLTTSAYDSFVAANGLQEPIIRLAQAVSAKSPQSAEVAPSQIEQQFMSGDIPQEVADSVLNAYRQLAAPAVAVRSSATAEDLPEASFAGQQDTFLNIRTEHGLLEAVKKCWASLWTARAIAYRQRQGIDPSGVSLAVVVQQLVDAEASGILFTANPTNGERDQVFINATWGLGEAIVGGLVTPDTAVIDKQSWEIVSSEISAKTIMTVRTETGTEERAVPQAKQNEPVLGGETAVSLAKLGTKIEAHYNRPMDIEWAIANGEITILQARPITSLPAAPLKNVVWEPVVPNTIWMRRQIVEHMPEPLSPLFEDLYLKVGMDKTLDMLLEAMGEVGGVKIAFDEMMPYGFAGTINGYAYTTGSFKLTRSNLWAILRIYSRIFRFFSLAAFDWDGHVLPNYQALIAKWDAVDRATVEDEALLQGISELATADSSYWFGSAPNLGLSRVLDPVFDRLLKSFFMRSALPNPSLGSSAFLRGFDSKALDAQADMEAIAEAIRNSADLRTLVQNTSANQLLVTLSTHPDGQPILEGIHRYLDTYGHQIYNLDFATPTQIEDPQAMLLSLKVLVDHPPEQDVRTRQAQMATERDELVRQTTAALNPIGRQLFQWMWKWTKHYAPYREHVMFYMGAAWPTLRQLASELGQRLTTAGAIAMPDDVYYLASNEIATVIEARLSGQPIPDYIQMAQARRDLRESRKLLTPLPKVPAQSSMKFGPFDLSMFDPTPDDSINNEGPILNGYAVSTGRVTAPASVIHTIEDFDQMKPDSILVCTTTTPAWTPLFSQAVGLVTDIGGALAHGSIVAREYGIPAVMGTGVATERIKSGMMLTVDGDAGTVTLLDEVDSSMETMVQQPVNTKEGLTTSQKTALGLVAGALAGFIWWKRRR